MSGEIEKVLERAARDPAFLSLLLDDREKTVASLDVGEAVKQVLLAADADHLKKMAWDVRDALQKKKPRTSWIAVGGVVAAAATVAAVAVPNTLGLPRETIYEMNAERALNRIALGQAIFARENGRYGSLDELVAAGHVPQYVLDVPYDITLEIGEGSFTATARHKTRPETRKVFVVGPDCEVRELKRGGE